MGWRKKYKGRVYYFSGGRGKSDREAYDKAVGDWESLKVKIDQGSPKPYEVEYEKAIDEWEQVLAWCNRNGEQGEVARIALEKVDELRRRLAPPKPQPLRHADCFDALFDRPVMYLAFECNADAPNYSLNGPVRYFSGDSLPANILAMDGSPERIAREVWHDRLDVQRKKAALREESLGRHIENFLKEKQVQADVGGVSVGRVYALRLHLGHFRDWLGKDTAVKEIDAKTLAGYHGELLAKVASREWTRTTAKHYLSTVKSFVRWLWQLEAIPSLPRNLDGKSQSLSLARVLPEIIIFTIDEIKTLLAAASDRTKLYILLMLNCGMTQKDIADLRVSEVNWTEGRIERKRSKTSHFENVPKVGYLLWPETKRLLEQERAPSPADLVLVNSNGGPLWNEGFGADGKYKKTDNVKNAFDRLARAKGISKSLKSLKKTSATLIRGDERFSSLESLFLGHAPQSMSDRHYTQVPQMLLDQAVTWLGRQYCVVE